MGRKKPPRTAGERAGLTREEVYSEAWRLYVEEGLAHLSMRRLAARLGVAPNALYSHISRKDELVDAVIDGVVAKVPLPSRDGEPRTSLVQVFESSRQTVLGYPDLLSAMLSRPSRGPAAIRLGEVSLELLANCGLSNAAAARALKVLLVYTFGFAAMESARLTDPDRAGRRAMSEAAFAGAQLSSPRTGQSSGDLARFPDDEDFSAGLNWILDGILQADR